jgi:hypothetical protein
MLCLLKQSFHEPSLPLVSCIKYDKILYYDLVIILGDINWLLCSLLILLLRGYLAFVFKGDARLNKIIQ